MRDVGIDLADVNDVRDSIREFGDRYLQRVFTNDERHRCGDDARWLASHFAAKEATMKALRSSERLPWQSIALVREGAEPALRLSGAAADLAAQRGVTELSVSLARSGDHAAAIVLTRSM